jgi:hypothetical protein
MVSHRGAMIAVDPRLANRSEKKSRVGRTMTEEDGLWGGAVR